MTQLPAAQSFNEKISIIKTLVLKLIPINYLIFVVRLKYVCQQNYYNYVQITQS